uniref:Secreted protein n=1 Tax=Steinernema glaseri TaxID=37863 RepID=A0A1I8AEX2_9BILA
MWNGFLLVCTLTTLGSTFCYLFSELFGREYVLYYFGEKLTYLQKKVTAILRLDGGVGFFSLGRRAVQNSKVKT